MVGGGSHRSSLERILTETQVDHILREAIKDDTDYELICGEVKPAAEGLTGFLGDHMRALLHVKVKDRIENVYLFVKRIPMVNKPKAEFIDKNNYFKRERLMFELLDLMDGAAGPNPWCAKAYIYTDSLLVMPDLSVCGFSVHPTLEPLDWRHVTLVTASVARYHAAFANYETNKILNSKRPYNFYKTYEHLLVEPIFFDTPWTRTAAKLTADLLDAFSSKYTKKSVPNLEQKLAKMYVVACDSLNVSEDCFNVMIHKDLWSNNILFEYRGGAPTNAILIDFQCVRYGPPAFDLLSFLYLTTSRAFREEYESAVFKQYFDIFLESLKDSTRKRLDALGYDKKEFLCWCDRSRMFGMFEALAIFPQVLMDPKSAEKYFDDPDTFTRVVEEDRSGPALEYGRTHAAYIHRQLEVSEEFVERYIITQP